MELTTACTGSLQAGLLGTPEEHLLGIFTTQTPFSHVPITLCLAGYSTALHMDPGTQTPPWYSGVFLNSIITHCFGNY